MEDACKNGGFSNYTHYNMLPNIDEIIKHQKKNFQNNHILILFEDCIPCIQRLSPDKNIKLKQFVINSRHYNISVIFIFHNLDLNTRKDSFERTFFQQSTAYVIFNSINQHHLRLFGRRFFDKYNISAFIKSSEIAYQIMQYPHIIVLNDHNIKYV